MNGGGKMTMIGESLVGEGNQVVHIDLATGTKGIRIQGANVENKRRQDAKFTF